MTNKEQQPDSQLDAAPEHLPDCPTDGAYGCVGTCPCQCHNPPAAPGPCSECNGQQWHYHGGGPPDYQPTSRTPCLTCNPPTAGCPVFSEHHPLGWCIHGEGHLGDCSFSDQQLQPAAQQPVPQEAYLTDRELGKLVPHTRLFSHKGVADASTDKAWHSRYAEVARLEERVTDLAGKVLPEGARPDSFPIGSEQFHAYMNVNLERLENERDAAQKAGKQLSEALKKLSKARNTVDNGYCSLCHGHRLFESSGQPGRCENEDCLSHEIDAALTAWEA